MRFSSKRLISMVMVFAFMMAASYQTLCAAQIIHCTPCEQNESESSQEAACKFCKQSEDIGNVTVGLHKASIHQDSVNADYVVAQAATFISPELIMAKPQAPPVVLARPLTDILQSTTPIRGPSITA